VAWRTAWPICSPMASLGKRTKQKLDYGEKLLLGRCPSLGKEHTDGSIVCLTSRRRVTEQGVAQVTPPRQVTILCPQANRILNVGFMETSIAWFSLQEIPSLL